MLTPPVKRERTHTRTLNLTGYAREDGLLDIEGEIIDTKSYDFDNEYRGTIHAGEALHHMQVRITINDKMEILEAEAETLAGPYGICPMATRVFHRLKGITIGPGWRNNVRRAIGGIEGCTHITELMGPIATVAYQTVFGEVARRKARQGGGEVSEDESPMPLVNTCIGHAEDPDAVLAGRLPDMEK